MPYWRGSLRVVGTGLLIVVAAVLPACNRPATAAGTKVRFNGLSGDLDADLNASIDRAYAASKAGIDELEFRITDQSKDALQGFITSLQANGDKITIALHRTTDEATHIRINIGPLGKEDVARAVIEAIERHL